MFISNCSMLPFGWTAETLLGAHTSKPYNPDIARVFYRAGYIEIWGRGIQKIRDACKNLGAASARFIHLLASYWGFVLMCLHLGLHWNMVFGMVRRVMHITEGLLWRTWLLRIVAAFVVVYGSYAFLVREFTEYMFLYDFEEPLPSFFLDYLAVMALFVCIGHYMAKGIVGFSKRKKIFHNLDDKNDDT